ncbi:hypothetical protein ACWEOW_13730 [Monashia sp. NPDC004114]
MTSGRSRPTAADLAGDVQRFGLFSAAAVVDRYIAVVDRAIHHEPDISGSSSGDPAAALLDGAGRAADAGLALLEELTSVLARTVTPGRTPGPDHLVLPPAAPGSCSEVSVWVHNPTTSPVAHVRLRATSLVASTGVMPAEAVAFSPEVLAVVDPATVGESRLRVTVPADQPAGEYQALVLSSVDGSRPIGLTLSVRVHGADPR